MHPTRNRDGIMKKIAYLLFLLLPTTLIAQPQQTFDQITKGYNKFVDKGSYTKEQVAICIDGDGNPYELETYQIINILNTNVFGYFKLNGYKTDLQKKVFKESPEYKQYETRLHQTKDSLIKQRWYYICDLKNNYDVTRKGFLFSEELYGPNYPNLEGYLSFETLSFDYATKRFPKNKIEVSKRLWPNRVDYSIIQKVILSVPDEKVALEIEQAGKDVGIIFLFQLDSTYDYQGLFGKKTIIKCKTESIYLVNKRSGKIFCKVL